MIAALLSNFLFVVVGPMTLIPSFWMYVLSTALILQGLFYGLAVAGKALFEKVPKRSTLIKVLMLPYYLCATNFAGIAGLAGFISGKRTVLWQQASRR
jgi:hypothetical protein